MSEDQGTEPLAEAPDQQLRSALVTDLAKLLVVAPLYPPRHPRFRVEAARVVTGMEQLLGRGEKLTVQLGDKLLLVQSQPVRIARAQFERLYTSMEVLGIEKIEIQRDAEPEALHALATFLLREKKQASAAGKFAHIELDELPASIRVTRREFGQRIGWEVERVQRAERITAAVSRLAEPVAGVVLDDEAQAACRGFAGKVFAGMAKSWEEARAALDNEDAAIDLANWRSLEDMLDLGVNAIRGVLASALEEQGPGVDVGTLLTNAEGLFDGDAAPQSTEDLIGNLRSALDTAFQGLGQLESTQRDTTYYELSVDELLARQAELEAHATPLLDLELEDRSEQIAILLQCLLRFPSPESLPAIEYELRERLTRELKPAERAVVQGAHAAFLRGIDHAVIDFVVPKLWAPLRFSHSDPLAELIADCLRDAPDALPAIWPHLVNELLLGLRIDDPETEIELCQHASRLAASDHKDCCARLARLEAIESDKIAKQMFDPPRPELFGLFAILLEAPCAPQVGRWLLRGLQLHPLPWPGAEAVHTFAKPSLHCVRFLRELTRERCIEQATPAVAERASEILAVAIDGLAPDQRTEPWVARGIESLGTLVHRQAEPLLVRIASERHHIILHTWPAACRSAARRARAALHQKPKTEGQA